MRIPALPAALGPALLLAAAAQAFDPGRAGFQARYHGEKSPYRINAVFLMPGETLDIGVPEDAGSFSLTYPEGAGSPVGKGGEAGPREWKWRAPMEPGLYPLRLGRDGTADTMLFNAFVMAPAPPPGDEYLAGYHIGKYPRDPLKGLAFYHPPRGFIRADAVSASAMVSPHFRLGQFVCKQTPALPGYLLLRERLILKLETVLEQVNAHGIAVDTFFVMSGYRTPYYNHLIGNVKFSAHQYGGAADIFIDEDKDGMMDDLNGDGVSDGKDSDILFRIVDKMSVNEYYLPFLGGVGKYNRNESHGPFVHIDVRGFRAVW
jgi:hypothetical protein